MKTFWYWLMHHLENGCWNRERESGTMKVCSCMFSYWCRLWICWLWFGASGRACSEGAESGRTAGSDGSGWWLSAVSLIELFTVIWLLYIFLLHAQWCCHLDTSVTHFYYVALLPRRGPHIASHSVCLSVCPSVRPSRYWTSRRAT